MIPTVAGIVAGDGTIRVSCPHCGGQHVHGEGGGGGHREAHCGGNVGYFIQLPSNVIGIPTFDSLAHAAAAAPEGYALFHKGDARKYIKERNDFIAFVAATVQRSDLTAEMKILMISMHPGKGLR